MLYVFISVSGFYYFYLKFLIEKFLNEPPRPYFGCLTAFYFIPTSRKACQATKASNVYLFARFRLIRHLSRYLLVFGHSFHF